jgi:hypothetical protein
MREYGITQLPGLAIATAVYFSLLFFLYPLFRLGLLGIIIFFAGLIMTACFVMRRLYQWYYEVCIVTNVRCVDIVQSGLFNREVQEIIWPTVKDVRFKQRGIFATLLHYGTIVLVLDQLEEVHLQHIYHPQTVHDILNQYVNQPNETSRPVAGNH